MNIGEVFVGKNIREIRVGYFVLKDWNPLTDLLGKMLKEMLIFSSHS